LRADGGLRAAAGAQRAPGGNGTTVYGADRVVKGFEVVPMTVRRGPPGGRAGTTRSHRMKSKIYRVGLTVAMLAVLVESLGATMKWG
jgi:hypothetical protein